MQPQHFIKCPKTKKNLTVSRDVYTAIEYGQKHLKTEQENFNNTVKAAAETLTKKYYIAESKDLKIAIKFDDMGRVNEFADPIIEFKNQTKQLSNADCAAQLLICINNAIGQRSDDMTTKLKSKEGNKAA